MAKDLSRTVLSKKQCVKFNDRHAEAIVETPFGSSGNESLRFAGIPFRPRIIMVSGRILTRYDGSGRGWILSSHGRVPSSAKVTFYLTKKSGNFLGSWLFRIWG